ncbi:malonyl-CoA O-methyltransferase [Neisseria perflava]|uniref:methyltransferase n=1 Tax=Neisseria perflava TaxID=33053 RepID=UPI0020A0C9DE|nr:methyltransferase [Neisseria perflava]MCP1772520.1 malonyl-CoA O-methyltransferase [Neisseria perflava]
MTDLPIHRHLAEHTDERLQLVRQVPQQILLATADADISRRLLAERYPQAAFAEYDARPDFLQAAAAERTPGFWQKLTHKTLPQTCQSPTDPLPEAWADMLWANLGLIGAADLPAVFRNWAQALKTDGLLFFTHFGIDTLAELKGRLNTLDITCQTPTLLDMHDLGDMLADSGFYDPVMDTAKLELRYRKAETFWQDMDTLGLWQACVFSDEAAARRAVDDFFAQGEPLTVTLETVYGHAVKQLALPQGESEVKFYPKR